MIMGLVLGRITQETPKYAVLKSTTDYAIRKYSPCVIAEVTYDPTQMNPDTKNGVFSILANYIGVLGNPQNTRPEKIAMTAPVITKSNTSEKISMTAPVITTKSNTPEKISMTAPVMTEDSATGGEKKMETMQFILPSKYTKAEEAPKPLDERVVIKEEGKKKYGVVTFSGVANEKVVAVKVAMLRERLEKDGYKVIGEYRLARYNPPWLTLPMLRTNEVMIPVE